MPTVYLALLIPLVVTGVFYIFNKHRFVWWEFFIPLAATLLSVVVSKAIIDNNAVRFTEYWGSTITSVFEEEPYNEWDVETCSYTTTDSKGNSTTHYYDCSHQDDYGPRWYAVTNINEKFSITEKLHDELVLQFKTRKTRIDSRRNHDSDDKCVDSKGTKFEGKRVGDISNIYETTWSGDDNTRKAYTSQHSYENRIKASDLTIFNISMVKENDVDSLGLFRYPKYEGGGIFSMTQGFEYPTILGGKVDKEIQEKFKRLNGKFGVSNQLRLWVLVFENKPMSIATYQENYWVRGNMNELVICIGKKGDEIQWSHAFSWSLSAELTASVKDEVLNLYTYRDSVVKIAPVVPLTKELNKKVLGKTGKKLPDVLPLPNVSADTIIKIKSAYPVLNNQTWNTYYEFLNKNLSRYERRSFKEFSYLSVEPKTGAVVFIYILAFIITIVVNIWVIKNEFEDGNDNYHNDKYNYHEDRWRKNKFRY